MPLKLNLFRPRWCRADPEIAWIIDRDADVGEMGQAFSRMLFDGQRMKVSAFVHEAENCDERIEAISTFAH